MLLNLSNHPSTTWQAKQLQIAEKIYGKILDMDFPVIEPAWNEEQVKKLAEDYENRCLRLLNDVRGETNAVHLMGELTFCFTLIRLLQHQGITCIASTTHRMTKKEEDNERKVFFQFEQFRTYPEL